MAYFWQEEQADGTTKLGLTPEAQEELGQIKFVDLPDIGDQVSVDEPLFAVEAEKAVLDLDSPITGQVIQVHAALADQPELLNDMNQKQNWVVTVKQTK